MAEEIKLQWPQDAAPLTNEKVLNTTRVMAADSQDEDKMVSITVDQIANKAAERVQVDGGSIPAIQGGATAAAAVALPNLGAGVNKYFDASSGYWKYNNVVLTNPEGGQGIPEGYDGVVFWDGTTEVWSISKMQELPVVDTSEFIKKSDLGSNSLISSDSVYIKINTLINTAGAVLTNATSYAGAYAIVNLPLQPNTQYTIGGFLASTGKNFALSNSIGEVVQISNLGVLPKTFTTDSTHVFLRCAIKQPNVTEPGDNWTATLMLNEGSSLQLKAIKSIDDLDIQAKSLQTGNSVPNPIDPQNAVNKAFFDLNGIKNSDLTLELTGNLANPENIIKDKFIGSTGRINTGVNWKMIAIDVSEIPDGTTLIFGNSTIDSGGYYSFYNGETYIEGSVASFATSQLPRIVTKATGATIWYIDISRPSGVNDYSKLTINLGAELMEYKPYAVIVGIKGYGVGGGTSNVTKFSDLTDVPSYAGNANKALKINGTSNGVTVFDQVEQDTDVSFLSIYATGMVLDLPNSDVGLQIGDAWVDNGIVKVKIV